MITASSTASSVVNLNYEYVITTTLKTARVPNRAQPLHHRRATVSPMSSVDVSRWQSFSHNVVTTTTTVYRPFISLNPDQLAPESSEALTHYATFLIIKFLTSTSKLSSHASRYTSKVFPPSLPLRSDNRENLGDTATR